MKEFLAYRDENLPVTAETVLSSGFHRQEPALLSIEKLCAIATKVPLSLHNQYMTVVRTWYWLHIGRNYEVWLQCTAWRLRSILCTEQRKAKTLTLGSLFKHESFLAYLPSHRWLTLLLGQTANTKLLLLLVLSQV